MVDEVKVSLEDLEKEISITEETAELHTDAEHMVTEEPINTELSDEEILLISESAQIEADNYKDELEESDQ